MEHEEELRKYINKVYAFPHLSKREEIALIKKIKENGDEEARTKLINSNLKSVIRIAKEYRFSFMDLWDLIQEGNIGIIKAIDKFDFKKRIRFSFYAKYWIKAEIIRVQYKNLIIELPINVINWLNAYNKIENQMLQKDKEPISFEKIAAKTGKSIEKSKKIMARIQEAQCISEKPIYNTSNNKPDPEEIICIKQLNQKIYQMLRFISPRSEKILRMRFGIGIEENYTLGKVGQKFGVSREAIRMSEKIALNKLHQIFVTGTKKFQLNDYL